MDTILNAPGLLHLAEKIFDNLADNHIEVCQNINQSSKQILDDPIFWLRKFKSLSKENRKNWMKDVILHKNSDKKKAIISYLQWNLKKGVMDLPCYSSTAVQDDFMKKIWKSCTKKFIWELSDEDTELVKILAPLTDNPNAPDNNGCTPIYWASIRGHTELVKILASLTKNPNAPNKIGSTPIHLAASWGHTEVVKILAPLIDNPNAPDNDGWTPIYWAANKGHTEIVKILAPLTDNPNAPNDRGETPIFLAARYGYKEIVKILVPLADNPNAPNNRGETPSSIAKNAEIQKLLSVTTKSSKKCKAKPSTKPSKK